MPINLEFRGRWMSIYGNLILIAILSGFTAGIYVPWGYARWQRLVTESTYFEDQQLEFDGSGTEVFVHFIVIGFYTLITLGLYIVLGFSASRMLRWQYDHTLLPNGQRMAYHGKSLDIFWEWLLLFLFTLPTLGVYYFWGRHRLRRQILTNVSLNDQKVQIGGSASDDFVAVLSNWVMTVVALALYALLGFLLFRASPATLSLAGQTGGAGAGFSALELVNVLMGVVALVIYVLLGLALLGLATIRLREWEVSRTLFPTPVRSRTPMPVITSPVSPLAGPPPPSPDATEDDAPPHQRFYVDEDEQPLSMDSDERIDVPPPPQPGRQSGQEDEYYDFADYSTQAGQEPEMNTGDERTDWSNEQWARPQANIPSDEDETERRADDAL